MVRAIVVALLVFVVFKADGQRLGRSDSLLFSRLFVPYEGAMFLPNAYPLDIPSSRIVTVSTAASDMNKVYLVDEEGNTASQGFAPTRYFRPNNNKLIVKGSAQFSDSLNPYGAINIGEALFLGAINRFITGIGRGKRRPEEVTSNP